MSKFHNDVRFNQTHYKNEKVNLNILSDRKQLIISMLYQDNSIETICFYQTSATVTITCSNNNKSAYDNVVKRMKPNQGKKSKCNLMPLRKNLNFHIMMRA